MHDKFKLALTFISKLSEGKKNFDGIDLTGAVLEKLIAHEGSSLRGGNFQGCRLVSAVLSGCLLKAAIFDAADLQGAAISGSDCQRSTFQGANLSRTDFSRSRLLNANLRQANLQGANFQQADLRGADFRGAILVQVEFRGAFYDNNTLFDAGIDPSILGMRKVKEGNGAKSKSAPVTPASSAPSKKKRIMYRGVLVDAPDDMASVPQPENPKAQGNKPGLTYRGVKL